MTAHARFAAPVNMPRGMSIPEWRALVCAVNTSWVKYVFTAYWMWVNILCVVLLVWLGYIFSPGHQVSITGRPFSTFRSLVVGLAWITGIQILFASFDWMGKRKLARRIGLRPGAPGIHPRSS